MPKAYLPLFLWLFVAYALCLMPGPDYWNGRLQSSAEQLSFDGGGGVSVDDASSFVASEQRSASNSSEPTALGEDGDRRSGIRDRGTEDSNQHPASAATDNGRKDIVNAENGSQLSIPHQALDAVLNDYRPIKELGVHFVLMFGIAFCFVRVLNSSQFSTLRPLPSDLCPSALRPLCCRFAAVAPRQPHFVSVLCSLGCILLLALSIELLQELLPTSFARGFALSDIWTSLIGGLLGGVLGIISKIQRGRRGTE